MPFVWGGAASLDLFFPPLCYGCGHFYSSVPCLCVSHIRSELTYHELDEGRLCVYSLFSYAHELKRFLKAIKFEAVDEVAPWVSGLFQSHLFWQTHEAFLSADCCVSVPIHHHRRRERGFNQVDLLFSPLLTTYGKEFSACLHRQINTPPLFSYGHKDRQRLISDAFMIDDLDLVKGQHVALFDDILTTGTTLTECSRVLYAAGARRVTAFVLCA